METQKGDGRMLVDELKRGRESLTDFITSRFDALRGALRMHTVIVGCAIVAVTALVVFHSH